MAKNQGDDYAGFNPTQGLLVLLGLLVPVLGYLGDAQISDIKREQDTLREALAVMERTTARVETLLSSIVERVSYFTALADERGRRLATVESDIGAVRERITRLESESDVNRHK
jgi:chromosome segregation ATPase